MHSLAGVCVCVWVCGCVCGGGGGTSSVSLCTAFSACWSASFDRAASLVASCRAFTCPSARGVPQAWHTRARRCGDEEEAIAAAAADLVVAGLACPELLPQLADGSGHAVATASLMRPSREWTGHHHLWFTINTMASPRACPQGPGPGTARHRPAPLSLRLKLHTVWRSTTLVRHHRMHLPLASHAHRKNLVIFYGRCAPRFACFACFPSGAPLGLTDPFILRPWASGCSPVSWTRHARQRTPWRTPGISSC